MTVVGILLMAAQGTTNAFNYSETNSLTAASLSATIPLVDFQTGNALSVSVNFTWSGTGGLASGSSSTHFKSAGFIENDESVSTFRMALATGTIMNGTTNYTPLSSQQAQLEKDQSGEIDIQVGQ
jgi:hypothetical protein